MNIYIYTYTYIYKSISISINPYIEISEYEYISIYMCKEINIYAHMRTINQSINIYIYTYST